jgi:predicted ferric reductase
LTDQAKGEPTWLRDFPWLGGVAPQWVRRQQEEQIRREQQNEQQKRLAQQWAEYDARQHAILQGHVDVTATGTHVAVTDPMDTANNPTLQSPAPPPGLYTPYPYNNTPSPAAAPAPPQTDVLNSGAFRTTGSHRADSTTTTGSHRADTFSTGEFVTGPVKVTPEASVTDTGRIPRQARHYHTPLTALPQGRYAASVQERPGLAQVWADPSWAWTAGRPAFSRHALAGILVLLAFGGGAEVIFLWWLQTPSARLQHLSDDYIMIAQLTGLLGGYLLLIEVALMARIPWLERRIGSWLATLHRGLGAYLVVLLAAHTTFVIIGYSMSLQVPASAVVQSIFSTYPYVLMATFAYLALLAIGLSSLKKVRHKLGYDRWHNVHLIAYPAAVGAFFHQVFLGAQFTRNAMAKDTWIAMHVTVAAAIILYRILLPANRTMRHRLRVVGVVVESADTVSIYVGGVNINQLGAQAGQYFRWRFLARGLWYQTHPFSLSAAPTDDMLRLTVKGVGNYTRRLKRRIRPGIRVVADGPYGAFTSDLRRRQRVVLVGGGVGVTPLRAIAETLDGRPGDVVFLQRASTVNDLLMRDELERMDADGRIKFIPVLGKRGKTPRQDPMAAHRLRELIPDLKEREVFICGSPAMARTAIKNMRRAGVSWRCIHSELFDF